MNTLIYSKGIFYISQIRSVILQKKIFFYLAQNLKPGGESIEVGVREKRMIPATWA